MEAIMNDSALFHNNFMNMLLGMSSDTKLRIIRMLTDSLIKSENIDTKSPSYTQNMLKKHAGAWVGDKTTEEIMSIIRENPSIRKPLEF